MTCEGFKKYILGEWTEETFYAHIKSCSECFRAYERDNKIRSMSSSLKEELKAPFLWSRIQAGLESEPGKKRVSDNYNWILRIAAVFVLATGLFIIWFFNNPQTPSGLLVESALKNAEIQQKNYEAAIE